MGGVQVIEHLVQRKGNLCAAWHRNTAADGRGCFFLAHLQNFFSAFLWWRHLVLAGPDEQKYITLSMIRPTLALQGTHMTGESACLACVLLQTAR